jgi:hypothetical protein
MENQRRFAKEPEDAIQDCRQEALLTHLMTRKRIKFCKNYLNWTPKQWENVMFSDELTFRLVNSRGMKVRRPSRLNRYKQRFTIPTITAPV